MSHNDKIRNIISNAPDTAGAYLMKDSLGAVLYVGKAKSLKKRLASYMGRDLAGKTIALMSNVSTIEWRLAPTESLALLLEASLIQKYLPKYNVLLRDDKSFPMVKFSNEEFPAVFIVRKRQDDGARYFGPYTSAGLLRGALRILRRYFPYRTCATLPKKACIYYRIGLSPAPCIGKISGRQYARTLKHIAYILEGRVEDLLKKLSLQMSRFARGEKFEQAAKIRDQINALGALGAAHAGSAHQNELQDLQNLLRLKKIPERIEAFDISNISGQQASGAMVSFYRGIADKNNYRRFRVKTVKGINDFAMLAEVVKRRYARLVKEHLPLPDLIVIDGGRSHLLTALRELSALGLSNLALIGIAKEEERIYTKDRITPLMCRQDAAALIMIRRIRDEAHRFAVAYHHVLRRKKILNR